jgi:hypothetical protein
MKQALIPHEDEGLDQMEDAVPVPAKSKKNPVFKCAECLHCKVFKQTAPSGRYILMCRCSKKYWRRGRVEDTCELHLVGYRRRDLCPDYESTSETDEERREYIRSLPDFLPNERHVHEPDGSFVDKTETMKCE